MIFRLHHETRGGHVHCSLFSGGHDGALGKCGEFTMRLVEFEHFSWLLRSRVQFDPPIRFFRAPPKLLASQQVAADWFTLPPSLRTKAKLLEMLETP